MRKVFLEDLVKYVDGRFKGKINWYACIGCNVRFTYDDINGVITIVGYEKKTQKLRLKYLDNNVFEMATSVFIGGGLGSLLGIYSKEYKYEIGDVIELRNSKVKILEKTKNIYALKNGRSNHHKSYRYKCLTCGNIDVITEGHIKENKGCPVCCNQKIVKAINDIGTTHPHLVKYFANIEDAYKVSSGSEKKIPLICPDCKTINNSLSISKLVERNFYCSACGDGVSYPEKFLFNMLQQIKTEFKIQKTFKWSKNFNYLTNSNLNGDKTYDFYIKKSNCIIESHGEQHYSKSFDTAGGRTLKEEKENDKIKENLAIDNGIENYIVIDCRYSEIEFIKQNILNSKLAEIFDLSNIDWFKCHEYACSSLIKIACDLWNNCIKSTKEIGKIMKSDKSTIVRYFKQGRKINLCDYETKYEIKDKNMVKVCELWNTGLYHVRDIAKILDLEPYKINNYLNECKQLGKCDYNGFEEKTKALYRKVKCLENGMIFESLTEASNKSLEVFNIFIPIASIGNVCSGNRNRVRGLHFEYVD
jgi:hypothetical protein